MKNIQLFETFNSQSANLIYKLVEKNHYLDEENDIVVTSNYGLVLKKFLDLFLKEAKTYQYYLYYFSEKTEDRLNGVNNLEEFFKYADSNPEILDNYVQLENLSINVFDNDSGKLVKTLSEYEILKQIYNDGMGGLDEMDWNR